MRRPRSALLARRLALGLVLALPIGLGALAAAAWAEEPPPEIRALDTADDEARVAAEMALNELDGRDELVAAVLRDVEAFHSLGADGQAALVRLAAATELAYVNSALRRVVRDETLADGVRRAAVVALGQRGGVADVSAIGGVLDAFPAEAARALASIGGRSAESLLRKHAGPDADPAIMAALAKLGDDEQLLPLVLRLRSEDAAQRERIGALLAWATGRQLPPDAGPWEAHLRRRRLAAQLAHEDLEHAQTAAQELAGVLRSRTSANLESDLVAILGDAGWHFHARSAAALVLGLGDARGAKDALLHAARNQEQGSVRLYAAEALARVGDLSVAVPLADLLVHDEDRDRIAARRKTDGTMGEFFPVDPAMMRTMLRLGCPGVVEAEIEILDGNYRTRMLRDTVRALREVSDGEDFAYEPDAPKDMRAASVVLMRAWWSEARDAIGIAPATDDPGWDVFRGHVAERIEGLGAFKFLYQLRAKKALIIVAEPALPQLIDALAHDELHVRMGAAEVLRGAGLRAAGPALAARLAVEENPAARSKLVWALERCGRRDVNGDAPRVVRDAVRGAFADRELEVRIAAARTIGVVGDPAVDIALLQREREGRDGPASTFQAFRAASAGALLLLGDASAFDDLVTELLCDDVARRATAADFVRRAGHDLQGYDADASEPDRVAAVERLKRVLEAGR